MDTILLDRSAWDLVADANGNIAAASDPYSQAQDAASAIRTFTGDAYYDTTLGVFPYFSSPPLSLLRADLVAAAKTVPGVVSAQAFVSAVADRNLSGQVQITNSAGASQAVGF